MVRQTHQPNCQNVGYSLSQFRKLLRTAVSCVIMPP
jgi:hypothetical protein